MADRMRLLYAAGEAVPFIKTGGLADVTGSLPGALDRKSCDCRVVLPKYGGIKKEPAEKLSYLFHFEILFDGARKYVGVFTALYGGIRYYFIDNEEFFGGSEIYAGGGTDVRRFTFFDRAVLEMLPRLDWMPEIIHCHDWQTALIPVMLKEQYSEREEFRRIRTVFTIHNLKFQGIWDMEELKHMTGLPDRCFSLQGMEYYGCANMMKGGILWSDRVTTVSETYAREILTPEYGEGLDGLLREQSGKLCGIVNGIDTSVYDPASDVYLEEHYSRRNYLSGKQKAKTKLQSAFGLPEDPDCPVFAMVTRLTEQKGLELLAEGMQELAAERLQLVILGTGDPAYEDLFRKAPARYPGKIASYIGFSEAKARLVYAGADAYLMPSRFEPCGISQLIAMRYGTLPVVRETGGLKDTVEPYNRYTGEGCGFSFANFLSGEMMDCVRYAEETYHGARKSWNALVRTAMGRDFSWKASAEKYMVLYRALKADS